MPKLSPLLFVALLTPSLALAHGDAEWIQKNANPDVRWCCGIEDCERLPESAVTMTPDGYSIRHGGAEATVPYRWERSHPSRDQDFWWCRYETGEVRCFFPPAWGM